MEGKHIRGLIEAYSNIYNAPEEGLYLVEDILGEEVEILDEQGGERSRFRQTTRDAQERARIEADRRVQAAGGGAAGEEEELAKLKARNVRPDRPGQNRWRPRSEAELTRQARYNVRQRGQEALKNNPDYQPPEKASAATKPTKPNPTPPAGGGGAGGGGGGSRPAAPVSQTVLAKKGGVEGKLDKATGKFTAGAFTDAEKSRYSAGAQKTANAKANAQYQKDRAAISTAKTPEEKAAATKKAEKTGMDAWAKANPKLAAAKAERDRTRGTSATTNPMLQDMKSKMPAPKTLSKTDAGANFGSAVKMGQSMNKKPAASKPAAGANFGSAVKAGQSMNNKPAPAKPAPTPAAKPAQRTPTQIRQGINAGVDIFDLVKGYLLDEGYAETEESAIVIMTNMSEEWKDEIVELYKGKHGQSEKEYMDSRSDAGKQISGDSKMSGAAYSHRSFKGQGKPAKPGERQTAQGRMTNADRTELMIRKNALKKDAEAKALKKEDLDHLDENRRAARSAGGYKDDSEGQPDPSKEGFTGIGKMSIKDIMALNKKIESRKAKKEETQVEGDQIDEFFGPKTVTPKNSPSGTKSVQVGKKYPALKDGQMVNVQYDKGGNKSTTPMTGMERGVAALKMRNTGPSSMRPGAFN